MSEEKTCKFLMKRGRKASARIRQVKDSSSDSDDETVVVKRTKKSGSKNPMVHGTKSKRLDALQKDDAEESGSDAESKADISVSYKSTGTFDGPSDMGATATVQTETEKDKDAQSIFERAQKINKELKDKEDDDKVYRGLNNYTQFISKKDTAQGNASSGMVRKGPIRAPENIRATVRWDYQPDLCKDYKETGYCGFGDSCKFMHDRTDYKYGWQLEMEHASASNEDPNKYEIDSDDEKLPFKCYICRKTFKDPVVTKCKHYFCEKCALENYRKSTRCYVCAQQTMGVFNPAKEIIARLKKEKDDKSNDDADKDSDDDDVKERKMENTEKPDSDDDDDHDNDNDDDGGEDEED